VPQLLVLSEERAIAYQPEGREVCVSIHDPRRPPPQLSDRFQSVLRLSFTDIARPSPFAWDCLFDEQHAQQLLAFVQQWTDADRIVIHCRAGQGRSAGVALALCDLFSWAPAQDLERAHPLWNTWVRDELVRVARRAASS
jgi:predicted protein tyrosine phosphatase